jgi:hypothetical protein
MGIAHVLKAYTFDWFYRVDDDAYVIVDNLRLFARSRNRCRLVGLVYTCVCAYSLAPEYCGVDYKSRGGFVGTGAGLLISAVNLHRLQVGESHC